MKQQRLGFVLSGALILAGLISLVMQGGPKLSIDFKGGTMIVVRFTEPMEINPVRDAMGNVSIEGQTFDFSRSEIKHFGNDASVSVRLPSLEDEPENFGQRVVNYLYDSFPGRVPENSADFRLSIDQVGPKIGSELSGKAVMAVVSALILILIYISIRFELIFALGAIAALAHDVLVTLGLFSILDLEISLSIIAAFLTIVGYSLNDTIVIFDRIRENLKGMKRESYTNVVNISINESLSRTVITSFTTFFVVFILWIAGGEVIHNFAFAMIIGVIVGTYSSIYVASPIVDILHTRQRQNTKK